MKDKNTLLQKLPLFLFVAALVVRFLYLSEQQSSSVLFHQPLLDEQEMAQSARQLLETGSLGEEPLFKAPLYPIFLAGVMKVSGQGWFWVTRAIQHFCGALLVLIAFDVGRRITGAPGAIKSRIAGLIAGGFIAFYGPLVRLESLLVLDFFTVFLQSAMLWALVRLKTAPVTAGWRWAIAAGVFAMLSWLNRPTLTPILPFLALWIFGTWKRRTPVKRRVARAAVFLIIPLLGMGLLYVRNARSGEAMVLPWQGGYNFYHANRSGAHGKYLRQESFSVAASGNPTRELAETGYQKAVAQGEIKAGPPNRYFNAVNSYWFSKAMEEIKENPGRWMRLMVQKAVYLVNVREIFNFEDYEVQKELSQILPLLPVNFGVLWPLALGSLAFVAGWPPGRRRLVGLMWLYLVLLGGAIALYFVSGRLRMPLVFPVAVLAGAMAGRFVSGLMPRSKRLPTGNLLFAGCLIALGAILSWGNWWSVRTENLRGIEFARLSNAAWRTGKAELALEYANRAAREDADYPTIPLLRGQALYSLGQMEEAALAFEESTRRLPQDPVAPFNRGIIAYYYENNPERAAASFDRALERQPDYHKAAWMSGMAYARTGNRQRAEERLAPYLPPKNNAPPELLIAAIVLHTVKGDHAEVDKLTEQLKALGGDVALKELADELKWLSEKSGKESK